MVFDDPWNCLAWEILRATIMPHSITSWHSFLGLAIAGATRVTALSISQPHADNSGCKNLPGDIGWPSANSWARLNATVGGRLIATVPAASVCHAPTYDEEACATITSQWGEGYTMTSKPADIMAPWFQNQTCVPFTNSSTPCELGNLASYSINVTNAEDVVTGLAFAKKQNIRLVVKNSGHDFNGKSTGKGALSLWTHNLDSISLIPTYNSSYYSGPAMKVGAGVTGGAAGEFASAHGYRMVVGSCPTVGVAGGYTQGGGHSLMTGSYGFGADNVLEWEVVTTEGKHVVATPTQNQDLYWALSGGGGGTYGVVLSMTSRVFPDGPIAAATLTFTADAAGGVEPYWAAVGMFLEQLKPLLDDNEVAAEFFITNDTLQVFGLVGPHHTTDQLTTLMSPLASSVAQVFAAQDNSTTAKTAAQSINLVVSNDTNYFDLYTKVVEPTLVNSTETVAIGGHYVGQTNMASNGSGVLSALRYATNEGKFFVGVTAFNLAAARKLNPPVAENAVLPEAQDAFMSLIMHAAWDNSKPWSEAAVLQDLLHDDIMPFVHDTMPEAGAYLNEASWDQADWQNAFYGANYAKLNSIKNAYDPDHLLYGLTTVGSEVWAEDGDGRLCKTGS
ncbi:FAD-binding domain-containing protein [Hypoxylon sp. FL1150]|nr:FAD-binding domain-containing protein [Hypoxylon sp. FL1150]